MPLIVKFSKYIYPSHCVVVYMEDDFALRYVRIYPGVNGRAELVTFAPGLRRERRLAPLARRLSDYILFKTLRYVASMNNSREHWH